METPLASKAEPVAKANAAHTNSPISTGLGQTTRTQPVLQPWIRSQAFNLTRHAKALRPFTRKEFGDCPAAPTEGHLQAVNTLMANLHLDLSRMTQQMNQFALQGIAEPETKRLQRLVTQKHRAHNHVQAIERVWDFYFELFGQRQSIYGEWLLSCDRIALDCYQVVYTGLGVARSIPAPPPFSYMRTGFGPATFRRGIRLSRLGRLINPFPLVQLPYHRLVNPWTLGAVLHEVSHNTQSDLDLSQAIPKGIATRLLREGLPPKVAAVWARWNREMFADLSGLLLGGPGVVASLMDVVGRTPSIVMHFSPYAVHPVPYLRTLLSVTLLRRMGFEDEAQRYQRAWMRIYPNPRAGGLPEGLLQTAEQAMQLVVDTVCYQPYQQLGGRSLAQVQRFGQKEQRMIEEAARRLARGNDPGIVPERFLIGAARFALDNKLALAETIQTNFYKELARR